MKTKISATIFEQVYEVILERKNESSEKSYVASLMNKGTDSILKKLEKNPQKLSLLPKMETLKNKFMKYPISGFTCLF